MIRACALTLLLVAPLNFRHLPDIARSEETPPKTFIDRDAAGQDYLLQGEYEGRLGQSTIAAAQIVALGDGRFEGTLYAGGLPGAGWDRKTRVAFTGDTSSGMTRVSGTNLHGELAAGTFKGTLDSAEFVFQRIERQSPTLGAPPPEGAIVLFDGTSADGWVDGRLAHGGLLEVGARTKRSFRDYTLHLEFRTPFMPFDRGQARGNSGLYLNDQYEFQILDSFGLSGEHNECGGYYSMARPAVNACLPPLSWQTYDVEFSMPRFDERGLKTRSATATVRLNGVLIHDRYQIPRFNGGGGLADESREGPIFLQDHGNPVHFRNIWIVER